MLSLFVKNASNVVDGNILTTVVRDSADLSVENEPMSNTWEMDSWLGQNMEFATDKHLHFWRGTWHGLVIYYHHHFHNIDFKKY